MEVVVERGCGLDVHADTVVGCVHAGAGAEAKQTRTFGTTTEELLKLRDWLSSMRVTHVAMESTGVYWKPVYNLLEGHFELLVVNAQHIKGLRGRKTDVGDSEWLSDLLRHGLLKASFIPSAPQRELRELTRYRTTLVEERARFVNRLLKTLEDTNLKLGHVVSDVTGVSSRAILDALLAGTTDVEVLADLARGQLRNKREVLMKALHGALHPHHRFMLAEELTQIDNLDEAIARVSAEIAQRLHDDQDDLDRLDTIPGVSRRVAEVLVAEIGTDMTHFQDADHLASWAGMCPGNNQSGGKRLSGKTRKGSRWLRATLTEAAHGAARTKNGYLSALYHRIASRRGKKRALVAVGHAILGIVYALLNNKSVYHDLGANYFDQRDKSAVQRRLIKRLERLGLQVTVTPAATAT